MHRTERRAAHKLAASCVKIFYKSFAKYFCLEGIGSKTSVRYSVMDHVTGLYLVVKYTDVVSHLLHTGRQDSERDKEIDLAAWHSVLFYINIGIMWGTLLFLAEREEIIFSFG